VACPDSRKFTVVENLKTFLSPDHNIIDIDGVRVVYEDGWGLVRASNTQPVLVLRFEAATEDRLKLIQTEILDALKTVGGEGIELPEA
jgi:phosphomannomutase/phosphoglucomutase